MHFKNNKVFVVSTVINKLFDHEINICRHCNALLTYVENVLKLACYSSVISVNIIKVVIDGPLSPLWGWFNLNCQHWISIDRSLNFKKVAVFVTALHMRDAMRIMQKTKIK